MSMCPLCGRVYCDHTSGERGQTPQETHRNLTKKELEIIRQEPDPIKRVKGVKKSKKR